MNICLLLLLCCFILLSKCWYFFLLKNLCTVYTTLQNWKGSNVIQDNFDIIFKYHMLSETYELNCNELNCNESFGMDFSIRDQLAPRQKVYNFHSWENCVKILWCTLLSSGNTHPGFLWWGGPRSQISVKVPKFSTKKKVEVHKEILVISKDY